MTSPIMTSPPCWLHLCLSLVCFLPPSSFRTALLLIHFRFRQLSGLLNLPFDTAGACLSSPLYLFLPNTDISDLKSCNDSLVCQKLFPSVTLLHTSLVCDTCPSVHSLTPPIFQSLIHFLYTCLARQPSLADPISPSVPWLSLATLHCEPP